MMPWLGLNIIPHFSPMNWVFLMGWFWVVMVFTGIMLWWDLDIDYSF